MPKQYGTPGPRTIHPSAATSLSLAACTPEAQLLFDRLIAAADDQGRLQGDVDLVKAACMPKIRKATPKAMESWLTELDENGLITRYTAGRQPLIQIIGWWTFQQMRHIYPSRWPAPEGWGQDRTAGHGARPDGGPSDDGGRQPGANGGQPDASAVTVPVPDRAVPLPGPGQRTTDAYKAHVTITGAEVPERAKAIVEDCCRRFGREVFVAAMYDEGAVNPSPFGFLDRAKKRARGQAA